KATFTSKAGAWRTSRFTTSKEPLICYATMRKRLYARSIALWPALSATRHLSPSSTGGPMGNISVRRAPMAPGWNSIGILFREMDDHTLLVALATPRKWLEDGRKLMSIERRRISVRRLSRFRARLAPAKFWPTLNSKGRADRKFYSFAF